MRPPAGESVHPASVQTVEVIRVTISVQILPDIFVQKLVTLDLFLNYSKFSGIRKNMVTL